MVGSPDPPLPYVVEEVFTSLSLERPIYVKPVPGGNELFVVLQGGESNQPSKILKFPDTPEIQEATNILEMPGRLIYGLEFHPGFESNGYFYVFSNGPTGQPERRNRVSRFTIASGKNGKCEPDSEVAIIEWRSMGHDGGDLAFGPDGMLYLTSGDGTSDSDQWLSAQDATNVLGGVLRIDVDNPADDRAYSIPDDNPFRNVANARGELWAIGLRNPWRMTIDPMSGDVWVGNNGQDLWETVHLVRRGENYGWSVYEGNHPFYSHRELGPGKLVPPTVEHHHREARSLTGGVVYRGDRLPELSGAYTYGDYSTGNIWAVRHDGSQVINHREIADTTLQIAGFSNSHQGELLVVDHGGGLYKLAPNPVSVEPNNRPKFPRKLSETGLFESVRDHKVARGIIPYSVNSPGWNDGATVERFLALPGDTQIAYTSNRGWNFSDGAVLMQTLSIDCPSPDGVKQRRIETRILTRQQNEWNGYSYQWNREQDDGLLVDSSGKDLVLTVATSDSSTDQQKWRIPSRAECMSCHSRAVNYVLGMTELQLNRPHKYGQVQDNQLRTFAHIGLFSSGYRETAQRKRLVDPHDTSASLEDRAKSYLHANCSCCHVEAGGGNSRMQLEYTNSLDKMNIISTYPQHNTFGIRQPLIVAPGEPERSILLARVSRRGPGQMPPLATNRVDSNSARLLREWIESIPSDRKFVKEWTAAEILDNLDRLPDRFPASGREHFMRIGCVQCHRIGDLGGGVGPNLTDIGKRTPIDEIVESIVAPSAKIPSAYADVVVATLDGEIFTGRIDAESDTHVSLRSSNSFSVPQNILKSDIDDLSVSKLSPMPSGTLNQLEIDEILDLLAFLMAPEKDFTK